MFIKAAGRVGLLGLIMGTAFLPYENMNGALPALIVGKDNNKASANFLNGAIFFNSTDYNDFSLNFNLNLTPTYFDCSVITHPDLLVKTMNETDEESNIGVLAKKLGGILKGASSVVSTNGAAMVGGLYFFKETKQHGPKRALFNTIQGYVEIPAILHYFGSYVDRGFAYAGELSSNVFNTMEPYVDTYVAPLSKSLVESGVDALLNKENQQFVFDTLNQVGEYVPSFSTVSKLGVEVGLSLSLGKVIDWYKKVDVPNTIKKILEFKNNKVKKSPSEFRFTRAYIKIYKFKIMLIFIFIFCSYSCSCFSEAGVVLAGTAAAFCFAICGLPTGS
jgi:hypothetical protein